MRARPLAPFVRALLLVVSLGAVPGGILELAGQSVPSSLLVLSRDLRRAIPITVSGGQEMVALDDLASLFQLTVREERGALTVSYKGRTIVLTPEQTIASVAGRLISLPAPATRTGNRWVVPLDFISRALLPIYDARLELRGPSHLLIIGDLRVPRVTIRQDTIGTGAHVTFESTPRASAEISQDGPQRLTVTFDADALDVAPPASLAPGLVQAFRAVDHTTIAIELGPRFVSFRASITGADGSGRVVLDLSTEPDAPAAVTTPTEPAPPVDVPNLMPPVPGLRTVTIDAGHGGDDIGAKGVVGTAEKDVTLAMARRLKAAIEARLGLRVLMTRDDDRAVAVSDRAAVANTNKADVFISLHANASFRETMTGGTVYSAFFDADALGAVPTAAERLPAIGGGLRDIELVPWDLAQARHKAQSDLLAQMIAEACQGRVPLTARPWDQAALRVLESANMPAVLIEMGYLTNAGQERQLKSEALQGALAQSIVDALSRFRGTINSGEGPAR